jgi:FkbM family methyltransferase
MSKISRASSWFFSKIGLYCVPMSKHLLEQFETIPPRIGSHAAIEVLSHFMSNQEKYSNDERLERFVRFYAENASKSYSQWSQDIWVAFEIRGMQGLGRRYLEIGGADGYTHSNTLALEQFWGWSGTLVEPDKVQFNTLKKMRSENNLNNIAISPTGLTERIRLRRVGQLSSLEGHEGIDSHLQERLNSRRFQWVLTEPLTDILKDGYDYLSLDVEGAELPILRTVDWRRVEKPRLITVEHNGRVGERKLLSELLLSVGYLERFSDYEWLTRGDSWFVLR